MKQHLFSILFGIALCTIAGCTQNIDVKMPPFTPSLVFNGLISPQNRFVFLLSETRPSFGTIDYSQDTLRDGKVALWENGIFLDSLHYATDTFLQTSGYMSNNPLLKPKMGQSYEIRASHGNKPQVYAQTTVPSTTGVDYVGMTRDVFTIIYQDGFGGGQGLKRPVSILNIKLQDNTPSQHNHYVVEALLEWQDSVTGITQVSAITFLTQQAEGDFTQNNYQFIEEASFQNGVANLSLNCFLPATITVTEPNKDPVFVYPNFKKIYIKAYNINDDYFKYATKAMLQAMTSGSGGPFSSDAPVDVYNNIQNGYGIFGAYTLTETAINL